MKKSILIFLLVFIFVFKNTLFSAEKDSIKIKVTYTSLEFQKLYPDSFVSIDTNLFLFHQYNEAYRFDNFYKNTGNIGSPTMNLKLQTPQETAFNIGLHQFDIFKFSPEKIKFYDTYTPFFDFFYVQGNKEMQRFRALHSRNINPLWNVSVLFNSVRSEGFYLNQKTHLSNLGVTSRFKSKNEKYHLYFSYISNKFHVGENGGLQYDSTFATTSKLGKQGLAVNLNEAKHELEEKTFSLFQTLLLSPCVSDSATNDSLIVNKKSKNKVKLVHHAIYKKSDYNFLEPLPSLSYYKNIFLDSTATNDSINHQELSNKLFINIIHPSTLKAWDFSSGIKYDIGKTINMNLDSNYFNLHAFYDFNKNFQLGNFCINGSYIIAGANASDFNLTEKIELKASKTTLLKIGVNHHFYSPSFIQSNLISNHLRWKNDLKKIKVNSLFTEIAWTALNTSFKAEYKHLNNWVFFDKSIEVEQATKAVNHFSLNLNNKLNFSRIFIISNLEYQWVSDKTIIQVPQLMLNASVFYANKIFKNKLNFRAGIDTRLYKGYYSNSYFAPFSISYSQTEYFTDFYPIVDAFIDFSVKRMRIFLKYEHVNQGLTSSNYFIFQHHPHNPGVFRFGFSWMFFD
ncbi:MAG: putative porin [Bacteroidota bacterium]|nr:putative porin [Bacteroidota bacterium]